ncbi:MAG: hypothetical protein KAQ79_21700 [Cyclobacteriaceae bacterium]|nr:hypothetical protein [Cyclobacteriaceae bacterium]
MKTVLPIIFFLIATLPVYAQTDGISYQAVIIDPNPKELPGVDAEGNILPNATIAIRFTILDSNNAEEYQEIQSTKTDQFGMINLMIGQGEPTGADTGDFTTISWDGDPKSLQVEIDFEGTGNSFVDMNRQELSFVPYAYHRDITATGTLTVDDVTDLNGELRVHGPTNLNSSLDVNNDNATNLSGSLTVGAATELNDRLTVNGITNINDSLNINNQSPTFFSGDITVAAEGTATFDGPTAFNAPAEFVEMTVNGPSSLNGQVTIRANVDSLGTDTVYQAYPLLVEGGAQGIAIRVNGIDNDDPTLFKDVPMSSRNNFISFWDADENQMWGRIEGQSHKDLAHDPEHIVDLANKSADVFINSVDALIAVLEWGQGGLDLTAALTSSTACLGVGACVTIPVPSFIISKTANFVLKVANVVSVGGNLLLAISELSTYEYFKTSNLGVSYQSGAGDYAEWLPKQDLSEKFIEGELVGIKNGYVTKNTWGVEKIMIVSTNPIVLGNMPQQNDEDNNVKIAFMGQVPARVIGKVEAGDYILPSELGGGFGKAVHPDEMNIRDYKKIAGVAWSVLGNIGDNIHIVNVAVGINTNDLTELVYRQDEKLQELQAEYDHLQIQIEQTNTVLSDLVPGFAEATGFVSENNQAHTFLATDPQNIIEPKKNLAYTNEEDILYFEISREHIESSIEMARETYQEMLSNSHMINSLFVKNDNKPLPKDGDIALQTSEPDDELNDISLIPIKDHPFWQKIDSDPDYKEEFIQYMQSTIEKSMHTHKKHAHKFTNLKLKE